MFADFLCNFIQLRPLHMDKMLGCVVFEPESVAAESGVNMQMEMKNFLLCRFPVSKKKIYPFTFIRRLADCGRKLLRELHYVASSFPMQILKMWRMYLGNNQKMAFVYWLQRRENCNSIVFINHAYWQFSG